MSAEDARVAKAEEVTSDWQQFWQQHLAGMARLRKTHLPITGTVALPDQFLDAIHSRHQGRSAR